MHCKQRIRYRKKNTIIWSVEVVEHCYSTSQEVAILLLSSTRQDNTAAVSELSVFGYMPAKAKLQLKHKMALQAAHMPYALIPIPAHSSSFLLLQVEHMLL
jgi:hypothetical protein